ncbi:hypothetical protein ABKV19_020908 [Rosa sericea]
MFLISFFCFCRKQGRVGDLEREDFKHLLFFSSHSFAYINREYDRGIPKTYYYPYSWTTTASILLFIDAPVATGFFYAIDAKEYATTDTERTSQERLTFGPCPCSSSFPSWTFVRRQVVE